MTKKYYIAGTQFRYSVLPAQYGRKSYDRWGWWRKAMIILFVSAAFLFVLLYSDLLNWVATI